MRYVGLLSYSLYLWHWPVIVLMRWTTGIDAGWQKACALVIAVARQCSPTIASRRHLRRGRWIVRQRPALVIVAGVLCAILSAQAVRMLQARDDRLSLSTVTRHRAQWYPEDVQTVPLRPGCAVAKRTEALGEGSVWAYARIGCGVSHESSTLFVAGDSHATAYIALLRRYVMDTGIEVRIYQVPDCRFFGLRKSWNAENESCKPIIGAAMTDIARRARRGDVLFLPSLRLERLSINGPCWIVALSKHATPVAPRVSLACKVQVQARWRLLPLARRGVRIVFEAPTPLFPAPAYRCSDAFNRDNPVCAGGLALPRAELEAYRAPVLHDAGAGRGIAA